MVLVGFVGLSLVRGPLEAAPAADRSAAVRPGAGRLHGGRAAPIPAGPTSPPPPTRSTRPAGGDHDPVPSPAGFYDPADVPTDGHLVHSLEHGFVVVWYRPEAVAPATVDGLRDLARRHRWVLVAPRPSMPTALAATAWHRRLLCPDGAAGPIGNFVTAFRNHGPEKGFV